MRMKLLTHCFWAYMNQPVFDQTSDAQWRPNRFWYLYKIRLLEKCWLKASAQTSNNKY